MKLRLHEMEFGSGDVQRSTDFFQTGLGLAPTVQQEGLTAFGDGLPGPDFNVSNHQAKGAVVIGFLTDDLEEAQRRLSEKSIAYEAPAASHLGMNSLRFNSPHGYVIKINAPGAASPGWLKA